MNEEKLGIDYSLNEYNNVLNVKGRCTLGEKTVYKIYVYTKGYAKRSNCCGLYILEEYLREDYEGVLKLPINFLERILNWFLSARLGNITELVFCDMYRCYPTAHGLYPLRRILESVATWSLRRDVITEFMRRFEATNAIDYIFYRTPAKIFYMTTMFPKRKAKYIIFIPTPDPDYHAINLSKLQLLTKKVIRQLERIQLGLKLNIMDGLHALGISSLEELVENIHKPEQPNESKS